jgi:molybdate transport system substrate-binding protein
VKRRAFVVLGLLATCVGCRGRAEASAETPVRVAVAANVQPVLAELAGQFQKDTGHRVELSAGSSGKLFAQIENGAPFDVFVSADSERPRRLEAAGRAVAGSRFTYAQGRLALYGPALAHPENGELDIRAGAFRHFAIAHPDTAPYGAAAVQVLQALGSWENIAPRVVRGENVTQTLQFVDSGGAELGLIALSTLSTRPAAKYWNVPATLHQTIYQDAVLLSAAQDNPAARAFLDLLRSDRARKLFAAAGYDVPR